MDLPDVTYAVLSDDGELRFRSIPSRAILRGGVGGLCHRVARSRIGSGLLASVADECLLQPDHYPLRPDDHHYRIEEAE